MLFLRTLIRLAQSPYAAFAGASLFVMLVGLSPVSAQAQTPPPVDCTSTLTGTPGTTATDITLGAGETARSISVVTDVGAGNMAVDTTCTLSDGGVKREKIANDAINSDKIEDGTITEADLGIGAVTTNEIADGTITEADLGIGAVTADKIATDAVTTDKIAAKNVTREKIADLAVNEDKIATDAVITNKIKDGAVTTNKIATDAVTTDKIAAKNVTREKIALKAVDTEQLEDEAVNTAKIENGAVHRNKIALKAVDTEQLEDEAVNTAKIEDEAVTTNKIAALNVTTNKIAREAVTTDKIRDLAVNTAKIADRAVEENKVANNAISTRTIQNQAVHTNKIKDLAVTTEKIATHAVVENKIADDAISTRTIQDLAVTTNKIADHAITSIKIRNYSVNIEDLSQAAQHRLGTVDSLNRDLREDGRYLTAADNPLLLDAEEGQVGVTLDLSLASTDPDIKAQKDKLEAIEQAFQRGTPLALIQVGGNPWSQGLSQQMQDQIKDRLNLTLWSRQEIGLRWDNSLASTYAAPGANLFLDKAIYENGNLREQTNYLGARIGLDPNEEPNPNGSLQAQVNYLNTQVTQLYAKYRRGTALAASLQDPYVPAGKTGSFSIATAAYDDKTALSFGLASIVGTRGRLTLAAAFSDDNEESLYRLGYSLSW